MDVQRLDDLMVLLSVLALPLACGDDEDSTSATVGETTTAGVSTSSASETISSSSTTSADETTVTEEGPGSLESTASEGSSGVTSLDTSSNGSADTASDGTTSGEVGPVCQAYGVKMAECFAGRVDEQEAALGCQMILDAYSNASADCYAAIEGLYMCRSEATCRELQGDACVRWDAMVETECV